MHIYGYLRVHRYTHIIYLCERKMIIEISYRNGGGYDPYDEEDGGDDHDAETTISIALQSRENTVEKL